MRELISLAEAAKMLTVSRDTVERLMRTGELPAFKIGGQYRFDAAEVEAYIESQRVSVRKSTPSGTARAGAKPRQYVPGMKVV